MNLWPIHVEEKDVRMWSRYPETRWPLDVIRFAPFGVKYTGRLHRVRSARIYRHLPWTYTAVRYFCNSNGWVRHRLPTGQVTKGDLFIDYVPPRAIICVPCERLARGYGLPPIGGVDVGAVRPHRPRGRPVAVDSSMRIVRDALPV